MNDLKDALNSKGQDRIDYLNRITMNSLQSKDNNYTWLEEQLKQCFDNMAAQLNTANREIKAGLEDLKNKDWQLH